MSKRFPVRELVLCALFAALTAVGAFLKIPVPLVPFTLQVFFVVMAGLMLPPAWAAASQLLYVGMGLLGLPVFTAGGGIGYVVYPTFGYLLGFIAGAPFTAWFAKRELRPDYRRLLLAAFAALPFVYGLGLVYYWMIMNYYLHKPLAVGALMLHGFLLVIPGDIVSCFLAAFLAKRLRPVVYKGKY